MKLTKVCKINASVERNFAHRVLQIFNLHTFHQLSGVTLLTTTTTTPQQCTSQVGSFVLHCDEILFLLVVFSYFMCGRVPSITSTAIEPQWNLYVSSCFVKLQCFYRHKPYLIDFISLGVFSNQVVVLITKHRNTNFHHTIRRGADFF